MLPLAHLEPQLAASLIPDAGYAAVAGASVMAAVAACAVVVLLSRKRIT
jgi:hypothetical protein